MNKFRLRKYISEDSDEMTPITVAYLDGYTIAERQLEGLVIKITIDAKGQLTSSWSRANDNYMAQFSHKWIDEQIKQFATGFGLELSVSSDCTDDDALLEKLQ